MIKKNVHLFFTFVFLVMPALTAHAGEKVVTIKQGDAAPFDGTLFNTEASARVLVDLELANESCQVLVNRETDALRASLQLDYRNLEATHSALQLRFDETILVKNGQIDFLQAQVSKPRVSKELTFVLGILTGIGVTAASAYTLNSIR
jgi:hypothetical protein